MYLVGCLVYWCWASGELQEWAKVPEQNGKQNEISEGHINQAVELNE